MKNGKPKILQLIGEFTSGGAETIIIKLTNKLIEDGWDILLSARADGPLSDRLRYKDCIRIIEKSEVVDRAYLMELVRLIKSNDIDIIHSHLFGNDVYGFVAAKMTGRKIIQTIHGMDSIQTRKRVIMYNLMAPFVSKIVTVSKSLEDEASRRIRTARRKFVTINNGIDLVSGVDEGRVEATRKKLGVVNAYPVIGSVGNVKPVKGYECLIESASQVIRKYPDARFLIVGDYSENPAYKEDLDRLIRKYGLEKFIMFLGFREDIPSLISLFDIFVLPSFSEGLSIALLEAMSHGKAIIATKVGGNVLVLEDGHTALMVEPGDSDRLARCIESILGDPVLRDSIAHHACQKVREQYSLSGMAEQYKDLYLSLFS